MHRYASLDVMYMHFFGLHEQPFSIAPDPRYLFMSQRHREALAHLLYGLNGGGGFVLLTGEIGAGKTTICRLFLEQIPAQCNVAYIFNPKQSAVELLESICDEFGITIPDTVSGTTANTVKHFIDPLNTFLMQAHSAQKSNILIIDEAQNLALDVLEQLRLLTNLETNERKLLQIVLIGQPELRPMLARPEMEQLAQRITARFHLEALSYAETTHYIAHRLNVAGMIRNRPFSPAIMRRIHKLARGIPRRINLLCDRALLGAYARSKHQVDGKTLRLASNEVFGEKQFFQRNAAFSGYGVFGLSLLGIGSIAAVIVAILAVKPLELIAPTVSIMPITPKTVLADFTPSIKKEEFQPTIKSVSASPITPAASSADKSQINESTNLASLENLSPPLINNSDVRSLQATFRKLGDYWSLDLGERNACDTAQRQQVYCYIGNSGLAGVSQLNRPAILTLYDDQNQKYYAVLTRLDENSATLALGERTETVELKALAARWRGNFITLWRGPPGFLSHNPRLRVNMRNAISPWIASRLEKFTALSVPIDSVPAMPLHQRLQQFQRAQGLIPNGYASAKTLMLLSMAAGDAEPVLLANDNAGKRTAAP